MLRILLKKELTELLSLFTASRKTGKRRTFVKSVWLAVFVAAVVGMLGFLFYKMAELLCEPLVKQGLTWVYFALVGTMTTTMGLLGSVFAVKPKLYHAKDNEALFAMPIPAWNILVSRLFGLYLFAFAFEAVVFVPAAALYLTVDFSVLSLCSVAVITFVLPLGALALGGILGWLDALLSNLLPWKNLCTILLSVAFMAVSFLLSNKMHEFLNYAAENGAELGGKIETALFPLRQMGLALEGNLLSLLWFVLMFVGAFALVYLLKIKTFFFLVFGNKSAKKAKYVEKERKVSSGFSTLFKREFLRLFKTPAYLLNASAGTVFMLIVGIIGAVKGDLFGVSKETFDFLSPVRYQKMELICVMILCTFVGLNFISAPTVSLEGETIWILQSFPVKPKEVFAAKVLPHYLLTLFPALLCFSVAAVVLETVGILLVFTLFMAAAYPLYTALLGLVMNLLFPKLDWTSETAVVKRSLAPGLALLFNWASVFVGFGLWFLYGKYIGVTWYCVSLMLLTILCVVGLIIWLFKKGVKKFAQL